MRPARPRLRVAMVAAVALLAVSWFAPRVLAFGERGHRMIALLAWQELTPQARADVAALLGPRALADVASDPDRWREQQPETAPWHYVNLPPDAAEYRPERDERGRPDAPFAGNVVERVRHFRGVLADPAADADDARVALIWLTHLVGDLHQPLHVALRSDRGGNDVRVRLDVAGASAPVRPDREERLSLHRVWDETLVDRPDVAADAHAAELHRDLTEDDRRAWTAGDEVAWANESWALADREAYRDEHGSWLRTGDRIGRRYVLRRTAVVEEQLRKAGVRLAAVLETALASRRAPAGG